MITLTLVIGGSGKASSCTTKTERLIRSRKIRVFTDHDVEDAQFFAATIVYPTRLNEARDHVMLSSFKLLTALILHVTYSPFERGQCRDLSTVWSLLLDLSFIDNRQLLHYLLSDRAGSIDNPISDKKFIDEIGRPTDVHPAVAELFVELWLFHDAALDKVFSYTVSQLKLLQGSSAVEHTFVDFKDKLL